MKIYFNATVLLTGLIYTYCSIIIHKLPSVHLQTMPLNFHWVESAIITSVICLLASFVTSKLILESDNAFDYLARSAVMAAILFAITFLSLLTFGMSLIFLFFFLAIIALAIFSDSDIYRSQL